MTEWLPEFVRALAPELQAGVDPSVSAVLREFVGAGERAWPSVRTPPAALVVGLAEKLDGRADVLGQLSALQLPDLYLALACGLGEGAAVAAFEGAFGTDIERAVVRAGGGGHSAEDLAQRVREKLFVSDGERPARICAYSGRGSLRAWVRVTSVRAVLDVVRWDGERRRRVDLDAQLLEGINVVEPTPEIDYLRLAHAERIPDAMRTAFAALTPRQRNLLRHRFLHGLGTDAISKIYGVHRATAYRWLEAAREALFDGTRAAIKRDLEVSAAELESLMQAFRSRLDVSMSKLLGREFETEN